MDPREADPHDATWPAVVSFSAEVAHRLGDAERARHLVDLLESQRGRLLVIGHGHVVLGVTERWLGMAHATTGDLDAAEATLAVAEAMDAHCGSPLAAARSAVLRASVTDARGDRDTAVALESQRFVRHSYSSGAGSVDASEASKAARRASSEFMIVSRSAGEYCSQSAISVR